MKSKLIFFYVVIAMLLFACNQVNKKQEENVSQTENNPQIVNNPQDEISNDIINVKLYLPDTLEGYYMATRFDWSGIIESLEYNGHSYFGQWFDEYSPTIHDAIMGPVEEFGELGYNEAKPGETFVKIGVGALQKTSDSAYNKFDLYKVANHGKWMISKKSNEITFNQELNDLHYSYNYTKTIRLIPGEPTMEILHTLKNTGQKRIKTDVYDHNFFVIDNQTIGPDYEVTFPFNVAVAAKKPKGAGAGRTNNKTEIKKEQKEVIYEITGGKIGFTKELAEGEIVRMGTITGFSDRPEDYNIKITNNKTGAGVRIVGDKPITNIVFWASPKAVCPEPYIDINVEPGQDFTWKYTYEIF